MGRTEETCPPIRDVICNSGTTMTFWKQFCNSHNELQLLLWLAGQDSVQTEESSLEILALSFKLDSPKIATKF